VLAVHGQDRIEALNKAVELVVRSLWEKLIVKMEEEHFPLRGRQRLGDGKKFRYIYAQKNRGEFPRMLLLPANLMTTFTREGSGG
jgi:hypothetical protein